MNHLTGHITHPMHLVSVNFPNGQSRTRNCTHTFFPEERVSFNTWNRNVISGRATNAELKSNQFKQPIQPDTERWDMFIMISMMVVAAVVLVGLILIK